MAPTVPALQLTTIDVLVLAAYLVVIVVIGVVVARRNHGGEDLFLAGRRLGFCAIGCSLFASNISSTTLVGLSGDAYRFGIAVANYEWMASLVLVFMAFTFVPLYLRTRLTTVPEFLEHRFDGFARRYFSAMTIFLAIIVDTAGGLYAGALVLQTFFPSIDIAATCAVFALVAGLYTAAGGLAAVVYTDVIQSVVLLVGSAILAVTVFGHFDYSWSAATAALPEGHLSLMRPAGDEHLPWLGTWLGLPILGFYFWATNQYIVQRVLGARDLSHARRGTLLAAVLKLTPLFLMVLPGAFARVLLPDLADADRVFPTMVAELLPAGVVGLVLAGLVAAIMSSVDSTLNSASTLVTVDFVLPRHPTLSDRAQGRIGRVVTLVLMAVAALWAPFIADLGGLFSYLQASLSYVVPPFAVLFLAGFFWRRGGALAARAALLGGHGAAAALFLAGPVFGAIEIHFTYVAVILAAASLVLYAAAAHLTDDALQADRRPASFVREPWETIRGTAWLAGLVVVATASIVLYFW